MDSNANTQVDVIQLYTLSRLDNVERERVESYNEMVLVVFVA